MEGLVGRRAALSHAVFVLTHHARAPIEMAGGTIFHFVTDGIEAALERARAAAGDKDIRVGGGTATVRHICRRACSTNCIWHSRRCCSVPVKTCLPGLICRSSLQRRRQRTDARRNACVAGAKVSCRPANAGTHTPRRKLSCYDRSWLSLNNCFLWLWVPAFAGTTAELVPPSRDPPHSPAHHPPRSARSAARRISRSRRDRCRPHCAASARPSGGSRTGCPAVAVRSRTHRAKRRPACRHRGTPEYPLRSAVRRARH